MINSVLDHCVLSLVQRNKEGNTILLQAWAIDRSPCKLYFSPKTSTVKAEYI